MKAVDDPLCAGLLGLLEGHVALEGVPHSQHDWALLGLEKAPRKSPVLFGDHRKSVRKRKHSEPQNDPIHSLPPPSRES